MVAISAGSTRTSLQASKPNSDKKTGLINFKMFSSCIYNILNWVWHGRRWTTFETAPDVVQTLCKFRSKVKLKLIRSLVEFDKAVARRLKRASLGPNLHFINQSVRFCFVFHISLYVTVRWISLLKIAHQGSWIFKCFCTIVSYNRPVTGDRKKKI